MGSRVFAGINGVFAVLFLGSAALQYNDPDPLRWIALYGAAAAACLFARRPRPGPWLAATVGAVSLAWAATLSPILPDLRLADLARTMKAENPRIEEGRELLGLLIVCAWMVALVLNRRRQRRAPGGE